MTKPQVLIGNGNVSSKIAIGCYYASSEKAEEGGLLPKYVVKVTGIDATSIHPFYGELFFLLTGAFSKTGENGLYIFEEDLIPEALSKEDIVLLKKGAICKVSQFFS